MAKTIDTIYNELLDSKTKKPELNILTSTSTTAIWRLIYYTIAVVLSAQEQLYDLFKSDMETLKRNYIPMTAAYWVYMLKNVYQYNETDSNKGQLSVNEDYTIGYITVDDDSKIVTYASCYEVEKNAFIKVSKTVNDAPAELTDNELNSVKSFVNSIKFSGTYFTVSSYYADSLRFIMDVYYDKSYTKSFIEESFNTAIQDYISNLPYDGKIITFDMACYIKNNVKGIKNIIINGFYATVDGSSEEIDVLSYDDDVYTTKAGYAVINTEDSVINYITYN